MRNLGVATVKGTEFVDMGEEAILYLPGSRQVHLLPPDLKAIYRGCEHRRLAELAAEVYPDLSPELASAQIAQGLEHLVEIGVLRSLETGIERRKVLAAGASLAAPVILSSLLPAPVAAISCQCPSSTYNFSLQAAAAGGTNAGNNSAVNANNDPATQFATQDLNICIPPGATSVFLNVTAAQINDALSVYVIGDVSRSRSFTSFTNWTNNDTCGAATALNVLYPDPATQEIVSIFTGLRTGGCDSFQIRITHCNYLSTTLLTTGTITVS